MSWQGTPVPSKGKRTRGVDGVTLDVLKVIETQGSNGFSAFSNPDALFTDLQVYKASINGVAVIMGAKFYYTTP